MKTLELTELEEQALRHALVDYIRFDTKFFKDYGGGNSPIGDAAKDVLARLDK
jgi:hypothetical protein